MSTVLGPVTCLAPDGQVLVLLDVQHDLQAIAGAALHGDERGLPVLPCVEGVALPVACEDLLGGTRGTVRATAEPAGHALPQGWLSRPLRGAARARLGLSPNSRHVGLLGPTPGTHLCWKQSRHAVTVATAPRKRTGNGNKASIG